MPSVGLGALTKSWPSMKDVFVFINNQRFQFNWYQEASLYVAKSFVSNHLFLEVLVIRLIYWVNEVFIVL